MVQESSRSPKKSQRNALIITLLDTVIAAQEQRDTAAAKGTPSSHITHRAIDPDLTAERIAVSIERLKLIRSWLMEDGNLLAMVDAAIEDYVVHAARRSARRDIILGVCTTLAGVVLGWMASLSSPQQLLYILLH